MKNERILSFTKAKVLTTAEIQDISGGAGASWGTSLQPSIQGGWDMVADVRIDG